MKETELYHPIKTLLENSGYLVKGEVVNIDVFAMKGEHSIAIELKTSITLKLIYQAIERQKIADDVYIAIPKNAMKSHQVSHRSLVLLLKRLSIGLIVVEGQKANIVIDVKDYDIQLSKRRNTKKRIKIQNEFESRASHLNIGGSQGKLMTAYREKVIQLAKELYKLGESSPRDLRNLTTITETSAILQKNYYGWFYRKERGCYMLSEIGKKEMCLLLNGIIDIE